MTVAARSSRIQYLHEAVFESVGTEVRSMDLWLSHFETVVHAIAQRRMSDEQLDRYARILQAAESAALQRVRRGRKDGQW